MKFMTLVFFYFRRLCRFENSKCKNSSKFVYNNYNNNTDNNNNNKEKNKQIKYAIKLICCLIKLIKFNAQFRI